MTDRNDPRVSEIDPATGQQKAHVTLPSAARTSFIRAVRQEYKHDTCGTTTKMGRAIAETYAANPKFYGATFCVACKGYFPVGEHGEFVWLDDGTKVGT